MPVKNVIKLYQLNPPFRILARSGWETDYVMKTVYRHAMDEDKKKSQFTAA